MISPEKYEKFVKKTWATTKSLKNPELVQRFETFSAAKANGWGFWINLIQCNQEELYCKDFFEQVMKDGAQQIEKAIQEQMSLRNTRIRSITIPFSNYYYAATLWNEQITSISRRFYFLKIYSLYRLTKNYEHKSILDQYTFEITHQFESRIFYCLQS